jgi:Family of unknown function (DUF6288)
MNMKSLCMVWVVLALSLLLMVSDHLCAVERSAFSDEDTNNGELLNLGPIGVRIKTTRATRDLQGQAIGSEGEVAYVFKNSYAEGKLQLGDVIVGVNGVPFKKDIGLRIGNAINEAEGDDGALELQITRQGKPLTVKFQLPAIGKFSSTFPYDCPKSNFIFLQACDYIAAHQLPHGGWDPQGSGYASTSAFAALALLSSGEKKYEKNIRAAVSFFLLVQDDGGLECWKINHAAIFLAEYYLHNNDPRVKEKLMIINKWLCDRQLSKTPFPYWFGHAKDTRKLPYAYLGVNVANALVSWSLIAECGIETDFARTKGTWAAVEAAGPSGEMSYAPDPNQRGGDSCAWGRTGVLAVANHFSPSQFKFGKKIKETLGRQWDELYFSSHGSSAMGKMWGALGTAALDPKLFRKLMDRYSYSIALMRLGDGRLVAQPGVGGNNPNPDFTHDYTAGAVWNTALNALIFAPAYRNLRITGSGLFIEGLEHTQLRGPLRAAFSSLAEEKSSLAMTQLTKILADTKTTAEERQNAELIQSYINKKIEVDRQTIVRLAAEGDAFEAWTQLVEFEKNYKGLPPIPEITEIKERLDSADGRKEQAIGKRYRAIVDSSTLTYKKQIAALKKFAQENTASPYAALAQKRLGEMERK